MADAIGGGGCERNGHLRPLLYPRQSCKQGVDRILDDQQPPQLFGWHVEFSREKARVDRRRIRWRRVSQFRRGECRRRERVRATEGTETAFRHAPGLEPRFEAHPGAAIERNGFARDNRSCARGQRARAGQFPE